MNITKIYLKHGKEQSLKRFHPWIFSGAINKIDGAVAEGDIVDLFSSDGEYLATGHYQPSSISVRVFAFQKSNIDRDFWKQKIVTALNRRKSLSLYPNKHTNIFRLIHGEGDNMPGLVVDIYGSTAVIQCHSIGMFRIIHLLAELIVEVFDGKITAVYDKSSGTIPNKANADQADGYIFGKTVKEKLVENGNIFEVSWIDGQKTGFFIDQRENRLLLQSFTKGKKVLNAFGYTGGFSVYALRGEADKVVTVDSSEKAIELSDRNVSVNFDKHSNHQSVCADVFDYLRETEDMFDLVIIDPPAFAKHNDALRNALQAYKRLNATAIRKLNPGGILFTFSCSQVVSRVDFRNAVFSGCAITGRQVKILHQLTQPADHPINIYHPEGGYLKGLVLEVE